MFFRRKVSSGLKTYFKNLSALIGAVKFVLCKSFRKQFVRCGTNLFVIFFILCKIKLYWTNIFHQEKNDFYLTELVCYVFYLLE